MKLKQVFIMQGLPGSGKSSLARSLVVSGEGDHTHAIVSADDYFVRLGGGKFKFVPERIGDAHLDCFRRYLAALVNDVECVVVDNTNLEVAAVAPYYMLAQAMGYDVRVMRMVCDPQVAAQRNTHGVPVEAALAMAARFEQEKPFHPKWWVVEDVR